VDEPLDLVAIGNAIVDVLAPADDAFVAREGLAKGSMSLVDAGTAARLQERMGPGVAMCGGSAANTAVGLASLGGAAAFVGKVADDEMGEVFASDIREAGVRFTTAPAPSPAAGGAPTARCLVLVHPDAQRTMSTFLGVAAQVEPEDVDEAAVAAAAVTYLEGYMLGLPAPMAAVGKALASAGRVALSLSDSFWVDAQRTVFLDVLPSVDVLFANEAEVCALYEVADLAEALPRLGRAVPLAAVTRAERGSVVVMGGSCHEVPACPVDRVVDTTGAGDLYAAGFLYGLTRARDPQACAHLGSLAAAEIISHVGARPKVPLSTLI